MHQTRASLLVPQREMTDAACNHTLAGGCQVANLVRAGWLVPLCHVRNGDATICDGLVRVCSATARGPDQGSDEQASYCCPGTRLWPAAQAKIAVCIRGYFHRQDGCAEWPASPDRGRQLFLALTPARPWETSLEFLHRGKRRPASEQYALVRGRAPGLGTRSPRWVLPRSSQKSKGSSLEAGSPCRS